MKKQTYQIIDEYAVLHTEPDGTSAIEIRYFVSLDKSFRRFFSEYLNFEERTFLTERWWTECSADPYPASNERAVDIINGRGTAETEFITVEYIANFYRIAGFTLGSIPPSATEIEPW